jgi:putative membrane protein
MDPQSSVVSFPFSINQWQRLSVFAVVYFFIDNLRRLINGFIYLIPALAINYSHVKDNALLLLCGVAVVNAFFSIATYKRFRFKLTQDKLIIQSGVFKREMLDLPYEKVQSVNIIQPFFFRFSGHAAAQLDSAGSVQTEAVLAALSLNDAQSIKRIVMKTAMKASDENAMPVSDDTVSSENQDQILNKRHLQDLIIHGISNNRMWLFLGFAAPFFKQISSYLEQSGLNAFSTGRRGRCGMVAVRIIWINTAYHFSVHRCVVFRIRRYFNFLQLHPHKVRKSLHSQEWFIQCTGNEYST